MIALDVRKRRFPLIARFTVFSSYAYGDNHDNIYYFSILTIYKNIKSFIKWFKIGLGSWVLRVEVRCGYMKWLLNNDKIVL